MNIEIVAVGASTSVGSNANLCAASVRAGLGRNHLHDLESGASCHVAVLPSDKADDTTSSVSRSRDLLARALREVAERVGVDASLRMYLAAPPTMPTEELLPMGARAGGLRYDQIERVEDESGLAGLTKALAALRASECDLACLAGVDVRTDDAALARLEERGLLLTDESPWGFIPGEGAGAVLLATERSRTALRLTRLAEIRACASDTETAAKGGAPCIGEALSRVCHAVLDTLPSSERVGEVYADLNGERKRASEWGYTLSRVGARCRDAVAVCMPALLWGDVGHASGALLLQLAACQLSQGHARGSHALVWTAGIAGARTAVLLTRADAEPPKLLLPTAALPTQTQHNASVIDELISEASFLFLQRGRIVTDREQVPEAGLPRQERIEERLDRHIQALSLCGDEVFGRSMEAEGVGGSIYVAARLALDAGAHDRFVSISEACGTLELQGELTSALAHAATMEHKPLTDRLLSSAHEGTRALGLWLAAELCVRPSRSWRELAVAGGTRALGDSFPYALARMSDSTQAPLLEPWLLSDQAVERQLAGVAYMKLDRAGAGARLEALHDPVHLPVLALACEPGGQASLVRACERARDASSSAWALGLLGTSAAIGQLIERLAEPALARAAQGALYLATGAALVEDQEQLTAASDDELTASELQARAAGDESVGVERWRRPMFSSDVRKWRAVYDKHCARFAENERVRLGQPLGAASNAAVLLDPHLPASIQRLCAFGFGRAGDRASWLPFDFRVVDLRRLAAAHGG